MTTIGGLIRGAMRKVGILAAGEPLSAEEGQDALEAFQIMLDSWSTESLLIPVNSEIIVNLSPDSANYTIGKFKGANPCEKPPATHTETPRPIEFLSAFIRDGSGADYPQEMIDSDTYGAVSRKVNSSRPSRFYLQKGWPLNTIKFEALPFAAENLHIEALLPLTSLLKGDCLQEEIDLPEGYHKALLYNLALELAPEWGQDISQIVAREATTSKKHIKRNNYQSSLMRTDRAVATRAKGKGTYIIEQGP